MYIYNIFILYIYIYNLYYKFCKSSTNTFCIHQLHKIIDRFLHLVVYCMIYNFSFLYIYSSFLVL